MTKKLFLLTLFLLCGLSSCTINQTDIKKRVTETQTATVTVNNLKTFKAQAASFSAFELDYDPDVWELHNEIRKLPYLESRNYPGCVFHQLLGSGNGPFGPELEFTVNDRKFTYYLNIPIESDIEKSHQGILIYYKDPHQDDSIIWGFQVFSENETIEQCFDLVKELLRNLRTE